MCSSSALSVELVKALDQILAVALEQTHFPFISSSVNNIHSVQLLTQSLSFCSSCFLERFIDVGYKKFASFLEV